MLCVLRCTMWQYSKTIVIKLDEMCVSKFGKFILCKSILMPKNHLIHQSAVSGMRYRENLPNFPSVYRQKNQIMSDGFKKFKCMDGGRKYFLY